jgi:hypothetical protein
MVLIQGCNIPQMGQGQAGVPKAGAASLANGKAMKQHSSVHIEDFMNVKRQWCAAGP